MENRDLRFINRSKKYSFAFNIRHLPKLFLLKDFYCREIGLKKILNNVDYGMSI